VRDPLDVAGLTLLAESGGPRLVLSGRRIPLAAHRARAAGQLTEIGQDLLAFDADETARLLGALGVPAAAGVGLLAATGGWAAGLRLAAGGLAGAPGAGTAAVSALVDDLDDQARVTLPPAAFALVAEYLRAEYLHAEELAAPGSVRALLLRTSVLDRVCAPLADAVTAEPGGGHRLLAELAAGALLAAPAPAPSPRTHPANRPAGVPPVDRPPVDQADGAEWYRYHLLLRATLSQALRRDPTEDEAELNLRAALWYAAHRQLVDATWHARRAGDWRYLACLVARGPVPLILQGDLPELAAALGGFPGRAAALGPECAVAAALARVLAGDVVAAGECLDLARAGLAPGAGGPAAPGTARGGQQAVVSLEAEAAADGFAGAGRRSLLAAVEAVELRRAELAGDVDATLAAARRALRLRAVPPPGPAAGLPDGLRPLALCARGWAELWRGRLEAAEDALRVALAEARRAGLQGAAVSCLGALALGYALRGRLRQADEAAAAALALVAGARGCLPGQEPPPECPPVAGALGPGGPVSAAPRRPPVPRGCAGDGPDDADPVELGPADPGGIDHLRAGPGPADLGLAGWTAVETERLGWLLATPPMAGQAEALLALALVAGHRGDTAAGLRWLDLAASTAESGPAGQLADLVGVSRGWLHLGRRGGEDLRAARRALAAVPAHDAPALLTALREATQADLLVAAGNPDAALRLLGREDVAGRRDRPATRLARGRAQLAQGAAAAAALAVAPLLRADGGGAVSVVGACAVSAVAAARRGDGAQAGGLLARAFALAQDEQLVRPFLDLGPEVLALTDTHPGLPDAAPQLVAALRRALGAGGGPPAGGPRRGTDVTGTPEDAAARGLAAMPVTVPTARRAPAAGRGVPLPAGPAEQADGDLGEQYQQNPPVDAPAPKGRRGDQPGTALGRGAPAGRTPFPLPPAAPRDTPGPRPGHPGGSARVAGGHPGAADRVSRSVPRPDRAAGAPAGAAGLGDLLMFPPGPNPPGRSSLPTRPGRGVDRLSDRELAVLSYLPTMLTTAEIAAELYVSVNTVKTHLKSIYRKLDVARRRDAVHRARALHLL
jgi:LuxR family maltose regulon positive regulatory protein